MRVLVDAGAAPSRRAKNTDTKEVRLRRTAAARALWGSAAAGERLDNSPLHLAVAAYINKAATRRAHQRECSDTEADAASGGGGSANNENEHDSSHENGHGHENGHVGGRRGVDRGTQGIIAEGVGSREQDALDVIRTLLECEQTMARSWWTPRRCTWRRWGARAK